MAGLARWMVLSETHAMQWAQLVRQGGVILAAVLLAHSGLPALEIGSYEQLQYLGALLSSAWINGLIQGLLSYQGGLPAAARDRLVVAASALFSLLSAGLCLLLLWGPAGLLELLTGQREPAYLVWFAIFLLGHIPASLQEYLYLLYHQPRVIFFYSSLQALAMLLCVVLPPFLGLPFVVSFQCLAVLGLFRLLWLWLFLGQRLSLRWDSTEWKGWLRLSGPLVAYAALALVNQYVDSWWVGQFYEGDETQFALYRYGARELPFATALSAGLGAAMLPLLSSNLEEGLGELKRQSQRLFHLFFPLAIVLTLFSGWWFPWVFGDVFGQSVLIFNLFMLIGISRMVFSLTLVVALRANAVALRAVLFSLALHVMLSVGLAYPLGLTGIALGTVLAFTAEKIYLMVYLWRKHQLPPGRYTDLKTLLLYTGLLVASLVASLGVTAFF